MRCCSSIGVRIIRMTQARASMVKMNQFAAKHAEPGKEQESHRVKRVPYPLVRAMRDQRVRLAGDDRGVTFFPRLENTQ